MNSVAGKVFIICVWGHYFCNVLIYFSTVHFFMFHTFISSGLHRYIDISLYNEKLKVIYSRGHINCLNNNHMKSWGWLGALIKSGRPVNR